MASVKKYGFWNALTYRLKKLARKIHPGFTISLIMLFVLPFLLVYWYQEIFVYLFYLFEIIVVSYLLWKLLKRLDRIRVRSRDTLRLFGLRILSGLVSIFGVFLLLFIWISIPFATIMIMANKSSVCAHFFTFGSQWHIPLIIPLMFEVIGIGLCIIGAYLFFKFQRKTGRFHWIGRI